MLTPMFHTSDISDVMIVNVTMALYVCCFSCPYVVPTVTTDFTIFFTHTSSLSPYSTFINAKKIIQTMAKDSPVEQMEKSTLHL